MKATFTATVLIDRQTEQLIAMENQKYVYCRSTTFHCHLIFVGRGKNENKKDENIQHNTKQWYCNVFSGPKHKNGGQLKHRKIMNEILWIYGNMFSHVVPQFPHGCAMMLKCCYKTYYGHILCACLLAERWLIDNYLIYA